MRFNPITLGQTPMGIVTNALDYRQRFSVAPKESGGRGNSGKWLSRSFGGCLLAGHDMYSRFVMSGRVSKDGCHETSKGFEQAWSPESGASLF